MLFEQFGKRTAAGQSVFPAIDPDIDLRPRDAGHVRNAAGFARRPTTSARVMKIGALKHFVHIQTRRRRAVEFVTMLLKQLRKRHGSREASPAVSHGHVDGGPHLAGLPDDRTRKRDRPAARAGIVGIGPFEDERIREPGALARIPHAALLAQQAHQCGLARRFDIASLEPLMHGGPLDVRRFGDATRCRRGPLASAHVMLVSPFQDLANGQRTLCRTVVQLTAGSFAHEQTQRRAAAQSASAVTQTAIDKAPVHVGLAVHRAAVASRPLAVHEAIGATPFLDLPDTQLESAAGHLKSRRRRIVPRPEPSATQTLSSSRKQALRGTPSPTVGSVHDAIVQTKLISLPEFD
jgi:hypothetical protein